MRLGGLDLPLVEGVAQIPVQNRVRRVQRQAAPAADSHHRETREERPVELPEQARLLNFRKAASAHGGHGVVARTSIHGHGAVLVEVDVQIFDGHAATGNRPSGAVAGGLSSRWGRRMKEKGRTPYTYRARGRADINGGTTTAWGGAGRRAPRGRNRRPSAQIASRPNAGSFPHAHPRPNALHSAECGQTAFIELVAVCGGASIRDLSWRREAWSARLAQHR